jgi:hypothetical protein
MTTTLEALIPSLLDKTTAGKLTWDVLSGPSFITRLGSAAIEITIDKTNDTILVLRDEQGRALERTSYSELQTPADKVLERLYNMVRRRALKVDEVLQSVKSDLDKL